MKHYLHDTSSLNNEKITMLYIEFGYEGIGLFYTLLEKLALGNKPVITIVLKKQLFVGKRLQKCWSFMESIGLISSTEGRTWCNLLDKDLNKERLAFKNPKEWAALTIIVFERDNYKCTYCGSDEFIECDHIMPFSKGGSETLDNLTTACRRCNRQKKDRNVNEFIGTLQANQN